MPEGFYTYIWLRDDGTPYYVGKGHGERAFSPYKRRFSKPQDSSCILIQEFPSEKDAFAAEMFLIAYYGRKDNGTGVLRNLTDGGENPPRSKKGQGLGRSAWNKGKACPSIAKSMKGNTNAAGYKNSLGHTWKRAPFSAEHRRKMSNAAKRRVERDGGLRISQIAKLGGNARWAKERGLQHAE